MKHHAMGEYILVEVLPKAIEPDKPGKLILNTQLRKPWDFVERVRIVSIGEDVRTCCDRDSTVIIRQGSGCVIAPADETNPVDTAVIRAIKGEDIIAIEETEEENSYRVANAIPL